LTLLQKGVVSEKVIGALSEKLEGIEDASHNRTRSMATVLLAVIAH
jgi:hypothetical protein